jgi:hypothetical protein
MTCFTYGYAGARGQAFGMPSPTLISADTALNTAAATEGLLGLCEARLRCALQCTGVTAIRCGRGAALDEEARGLKSVLRSCVPQVLALRCLLHSLYARRGT